MQHSPKGKKLSRQRGNMLTVILVAVILVAYLTRMIASSTEEQSDIIVTQTSDDEVNRLFGQASALGGALQQMIVNGEDPATLYTNLSLLKPGDVGFDTSPHNFKIYHPLGGGIAYMSSSNPGNSDAIATSLAIDKGAIITGVGETDAVVGDIVFTAKITTTEACARINQILLGSTSIPDLNAVVFADLFDNSVTTTINAGACASCVNQSRMCVKKSGANQWGYYASLLPG